MTKHIACNDLVPGCAFAASAASEQELIEKVSEHAAQQHGVKDVTPELAAKGKAAIQSR